MNIHKPWQSRILRKPDDGGGSGGGDGSSAAATTIGDVTNANQANNSSSASVPSIGSEAPKGDATDWRKDWAPELKDNPALKDFKTPADLAKSYVETKKMVGQKTTGIPGKDATPEQIAEFRKAYGVPDKPEDYGFEPPKDLPEKLAALYNKEDSDKWAKRMHELGVPKEVANTIRNEYFAEVAGWLKDVKEDVGRTDADFDKVMKETFGDRQELVTKQGRTAVEKYVDPKLKPVLESFDNKQLAVLGSMASGIFKELAGEDTALSDGETTPVKSEGELRAELREIYADEAYSNPFKGKEKHNQLNARAKEIGNQIAQIQAAGTKRK